MRPVCTGRDHEGYIRWFETVAEEEDCASSGQLARAAKDKIVEALSARYPALLLVKMQRYVLDDGEPCAFRVVAWIKLLKSWACPRWSDLQVIKPAELRLTEGRLSTILRKTKTSRPNIRIKELPVCVKLPSTRLETGFELLRDLAS